MNELKQFRMSKIMEKQASQSSAFTNLRHSVVKFRHIGFGQFLEHLLIEGGLIGTKNGRNGYPDENTEHLTVSQAVLRVPDYSIFKKQPEKSNFGNIDSYLITAAEEVFSLMLWEDFWTILSAVMMEKSVVFVSKGENMPEEEGKKYKFFRELVQEYHLLKNPQNKAHSRMKRTKSKSIFENGLDKIIQQYHGYKSKKETEKMAQILESQISNYNAEQYICETLEQIQGQKLVTSAVILFSRIIKPLIWSHPKILSLPQNKLQLLSAPFPLLVGLNMSPSCFYNGNQLSVYDEKSFEYQNSSLAYDLICKNDDLLTVFLTKGLMKASRLELLVPLKMRQNMYNPYFSSMKSQMQSLYSDFFFKQVKNGEDGTLELILLKFREILFEFFIKPLPLKPLFKNATKNLDMEMLEELLVENNPLDEIFMRVVVRSQMFCHFLERHYDVS